MADEKETKVKEVKIKKNSSGVPMGVQLTHSQVHAMKNRKIKKD